MSEKPRMGIGGVLYAVPFAALFWLALLGWLVSPWLSLFAALAFTAAVFLELERGSK